MDGLYDIRRLDEICKWCLFLVLFSKKRRELFWCIKTGGEFYGSGDFCPVGGFPALCWHIPLTPRNFVFSKRACGSGFNEVVEHVVFISSFSLYIQLLSTFYSNSS